METLMKPDQIEGGLALLGNPRRMLDQAQDVANLLMEVVAKQKLSKKIGQSEHIYVTAWQFLAHFYGISAKVTDVRPFVDEITGAAGFEATADAILISTGMVISSGRALCLNNETNWSMRPKYEYENNQRRQVGEEAVPSFQLYSMSETRAIGKALSNILRFVVTLAGYETTPAEEMAGEEKQQRANGKDPQEKKTAGPKRITDPQRKRMFAIMHEHQVPTLELVNIIKKHGFNQAFEVTMDKYDAVVADIEKWSPQQAA